MRVLIVDDHQVFRFGVRHTLAATGGFEVMGEASNVLDALALLDQETPDVVLMDIEMPGMDGVLATREICRRTPAPRVLVMSFYDHIGDLLDALSGGNGLRLEVRRGVRAGSGVANGGARRAPPDP
jgi:DNA-binding NarL/FixJ family response regulator